MEREKILTVVKGEEFKLSFKEEIKETDIFYDQYLEAAGMLEDIVAINENRYQESWRKVETENNIIAFCGDRGEGKSSVMMSFINAVIKSGDKNVNDIFKGCKQVKNTVFSKPIVIDPSTFDNVHNILEIVVASIFREFRDRYEKDSRAFDDYKREKLLDEFQKVYRIISLMNNPEKMLEEEFDGEGSITNLSGMGESTELKEKLQSLIKTYLDCIVDGGDPENKKMLIAIDDLDLCNANAYKMAEQIRKYLIIPNVVIVIALKVEQLNMCVQEENFQKYKNVLHSGSKPSEFYEDVKNMAEKYISKLIPGARRIYLPNIHYIDDVKIKYVNKDGNILYEDEMVNSLNQSLLDLIYVKSGIRFLLNNGKMSYLQPDNLRDAVNLITLFGDMKTPEQKDEYYDNIKKFELYFEKQWLPHNISVVDYRELQDLTQMTHLQMHSQGVYLLKNNYEKIGKKNKYLLGNYWMERENCFFWIIKWLNNYKESVFDKKYEKFEYAFYIAYSIKLSELYRTGKNNELSDFIGGYIWGDDFNGMLPSVSMNGQYIMRSRFSVLTTKTYNAISEYIAEIFDIKGTQIDKYKRYISKINGGEENREYIMFNWFLTGLLCNMYSTEKEPNSPIYHNTLIFDRFPIIYSNYVLSERVQICLENYIVGMCNLNVIYEKLNMEMLGISKEEFSEFVKKIEKNNSEKIEAFRKTITSVDLIMKFFETCFKRRDSKEGGEKDELKKTEATVDRFFRNIERFMKEYGIINANSDIKMNLLILENADGVKQIINISKCYATLFMSCLEEIKAGWNDQKQKLVDEFNNSLFGPIVIDPDKGRIKKNVSRYLINKSAQNVKRNLDNLAYNINDYSARHPEIKNLEFSLAGLREYYSRIIDIFIEDPKREVSAELQDEYKEIIRQNEKFLEE